VKLGGSSGSGQGSNNSGKGAQGGNGKGSQGGSGHDRWMAECADCGEEGDLLCCEVGPSHHNARHDVSASSAVIYIKCPSLDAYIRLYVDP